jgi:hypothetical protein
VASALSAGERGAAGPSPGEPSSGARAERRRGLVALGVTLLPLVVGALVVVFQTHGSYHPTGDHALIELQARDVGVHPVLVGLYSREDWSHPGPAFAYLSAPVYRLLGEATVSLDLVALLANGGALAGMALIARRLAGTPVMLITLLAEAFLIRTLGTEFLRDPWNPYVTVLPYGLMVFLTWAMLCRQLWALPVGVAVATYLAQTHVGFVALAMPLLALGAAGLVWGVWRELDDADVPPAAAGEGDRAADHAGPGRAERRRTLVRVMAGSVALFGMLWIPTVVDALGPEPSNLGNVVGFFRDSGEHGHSLLEAWGAVTGQFAIPPEWLIDSNGQSWTGEDAHMYSRPAPVLLLVVALAAVVVWRRRGEVGRGLVIALTATISLGIVGITRTIGGAWYYRLRWLWIAPAVAFVLVVWALWILVTRRWPERGGRVLRDLTLAILVVLAGVNAYTAVTTDTVMDADSDVVAALMPGILAEVDRHDEGVIVVNDMFGVGAWYSRGIVLELERLGYDVRVSTDQRHIFDDRFVWDGEPVAVELAVVRDEYIEDTDANAQMRQIARWTSVTRRELVRVEREQAELDADYEAGRIGDVEYFLTSPRIGLYDNDLATYFEVRVYVNEAGVGA